MKVVDLFAGCGGLSYGFKLAGFDIVLGIDCDRDCAKTFLKNHPGSDFIVGDIKKISEEQLRQKIGKRKISVLVGGPPCQGFSVSGKRVFMNPQNSLYLEFFRILDILNPEFVLLENVPGLKSLYKGQALINILMEFKKRGFFAAPELLVASDYGVPQSRKRLFIVASKKGLFEFPKPYPKKITLSEAISDLSLLENKNEDDKYISPPQNEYQKFMRKKSKKVYNHIAVNHSERTKNIIRLVPEGGNYKSLPKELQNTRKVNIAWTRLDSSKPSLTIDTGHRHHFHPWTDRVPTVRESARIQSFPDNFIFYGSKTSQYRQVGNAVPPLLACAVAKQIKRWLESGQISGTQRTLFQTASH